MCVYECMYVYTHTHICKCLLLADFTELEWKS